MSYSRFTLLFFLIAFPGRSEARAGEAGPLVRVKEGKWLNYKGTVKVTRREVGDDPEHFSASLQVGYLGMGAIPGGAHQEKRVLLFRSGESPEIDDLTFSEAVSLISGPNGSLRAELPVKDRAARVSWFSFHHLPLNIFPSLSSSKPGEWKSTAKLHVFSPRLMELAVTRRVEQVPNSSSIRLVIESDPDQRVVFLEDRVEVPFQVTGLQQIYTIVPLQGRLMSFKSRLEGKFLGTGATREITVEIELALREALNMKKREEWARLRSGAELVLQIERALFKELDPEGAESMASAFTERYPDSRLQRFAAGLARQADALWPIAREQRLYGKSAPDFTLLDLSGKKVTFSSLLPGKVTLLSFWSVG